MPLIVRSVISRGVISQGAIAIGLSLGVAMSGLVGISPVQAATTPVQAATTAEEYRLLGLSHRQQGRYAEAIAAMETAVTLAPQDTAGHLLLGWTQHLAQDSAATATLGQALALNPFSVQAANALGIAYLVRDQLSTAILTHLWASYLQSDNEIAYFNLSLAAHRIHYYDWAVQLADQAMALEPANPHPRIARALAHWSNGNRSQALDDYRQAIPLNPRYGTAAGALALEVAAFSPDQIAVAQAILAAMRSGPDRE